MKRFCLALLLAASVAQAGEPTPPGGISDEPPPARSSTSLPPAATSTSGVSSATKLNEWGPDHKYAVGARLRYLFVTEAMFSPYLQASKAMNGVSVAAEFEYRKPNFDVVVSLDYSAFYFDDGNWLANNHLAQDDTKLTQFKGLSFLSADVSIIGHRWLTPWMEIRGGAGLGVGVVFGDVLVTASQGCMPGNVKDMTVCHPTVTGPINGSVTPQQEAALKATESTAPNVPSDPHRKPGGVPPAMGVLNIVGGMRFKVHPHVLLGWELGFRDSMFFGLHSDYRF